jgi:DNA-binding MarR family transcriptional regulator
MQAGLAGIELSPSAVHTIIEIGYGTVTNASGLGTLLHLEKSSVSRLVQKLENESLIEVGPDPSDKRSQVLSLTHGGKSLLGEIEAYARQQLGSALNEFSVQDVTSMTKMASPSFSVFTALARISPVPKFMATER